MAWARPQSSSDWHPPPQPGGPRCWVFDLDPQGNATTGLGLFDPGPGVDAVLDEERPGGLSTVVESGGWPSDIGPIPRIAPSSPGLSIREPQLATDPLGAQDRLAIAMRPPLQAAPDVGPSGHPGVDDEDRLVLIDCPPSLGLLTVNALFAADVALVVTEPGAWAVDGVGRMLQTIERIRIRRPNGRPEVVGIAVNRLAAPGTGATGMRRFGRRIRGSACRRCIYGLLCPRPLPSPCPSTRCVDLERPRRLPSSMCCWIGWRR
ncbi:MAG: hypothetical protein CM1200mP26_21110 [Acidimicrobiales bacterium]|nr:MAG: hypothetical protein CM1200mP26_21110 [Acidimicrobiales bacterium]